mmetsp:Transcript_40688/g.53376  ORF Transcript_40688/g.53376 Transcript_40688/m.53376 type:complete len:126 (-) Transcript_40688:32-409(-)
MYDLSWQLFQISYMIYYPVLLAMLGLTMRAKGVNLYPSLLFMMRMVPLYLLGAVSFTFFVTFLFFESNKVMEAESVLADVAFLVLWESVCFVATEFLFNDVMHFIAYHKGDYLYLKIDGSEDRTF